MSDAVVNGLAGAGGGVVAQLLTYPLQAVNTRQQIERKLKKEVAPRQESVAHRNSVVQKLLQNEFVKVVKQEGWGGLYRGLRPSLVGTISSQGVYYYFYQLFKLEAEALALKRQKRGKGDGTIGMFSALVVASLAGCVNVLMTNPIWVIVTRMQTQAKAQVQATLAPLLESNLEEADANKIADLKAQALSVHPQGAYATAHELYEEAGILGFWKGVLPTLIMVSNPAIQFMLYETLVGWLTKKRALKINSPQGLTASEIFTFASIGKLGATVATYPLLVVKSRLQAKQSMNGDKGNEYTGTFDAFVKMVYQEGILGLYRGMSTKIVQSVVAAAVLLMIKEELVKGARALTTKKRVKS